MENLHIKHTSIEDFKANVSSVVDSKMKMESSWARADVLDNLNAEKWNYLDEALKNKKKKLQESGVENIDTITLTDEEEKQAHLENKLKLQGVLDNEKDTPEYTTAKKDVVNVRNKAIAEKHEIESVQKDLSLLDSQKEKLEAQKKASKPKGFSNWFKTKSKETQDLITGFQKDIENIKTDRENVKTTLKSLIEKFVGIDESTLDTLIEDGENTKNILLELEKRGIYLKSNLTKDSNSLERFKKEYEDFLQVKSEEGDLVSIPTENKTDFYYEQQSLRRDIAHAKSQIEKHEDRIKFKQKIENEMSWTGEIPDSEELSGLGEELQRGYTWSAGNPRAMYTYEPTEEELLKREEYEKTLERYIEARNKSLAEQDNVHHWRKKLKEAKEAGQPKEIVDPIKKHYQQAIEVFEQRDVDTLEGFESNIVEFEKILDHIENGESELTKETPKMRKHIKEYRLGVENYKNQAQASEEDILPSLEDFYDRKLYVREDMLKINESLSGHAKEQAKVWNSEHAVALRDIRSEKEVIDRLLRKREVITETIESELKGFFYGVFSIKDVLEDLVKNEVLPEENMIKLNEALLSYAKTYRAQLGGKKEGETRSTIGDVENEKQKVKKALQNLKSIVGQGVELNL